MKTFTRDEGQVERPIAWPSLLPGGGAVLVSDWSAGLPVGRLAIVDLESGRMTDLGIEGSGAHVLPDGYLVCGSAAAVLMGVPFDIANRRITGTPVALIQDIAFGRNNVPVFAVSPTGTLVFATGYLRGSRREPMRLVRASPSGELTVLPFEPDLLYRGFALTRDGTRLAVGAWDGARWVYDLRRSTRLRLPPLIIGDLQSLVWSPDGSHLAVTGPARGGAAWQIVVEQVDGGAAPRTLHETTGSEVMVGG